MSRGTARKQTQGTDKEFETSETTHDEESQRPDKQDEKITLNHVVEVHLKTSTDGKAQSYEYLENQNFAETKHVRKSIARDG